VLAFASGRTGHDDRVNVGYALVYPVAMLVKLVLAQLIAG
jgi:putative transport protein